MERYYFIKSLLCTAVLCYATLTGTAQEVSSAVQFKNLGEPAPALHITKWLKGDSIAEFKKGRVYVVEFWATWCQPCIAGMPHLSELARKYKNDVSIIGVSIKERQTTTMADIEKFVKGMGDKMDYNVAVERGSAMGDNWMTAFGERGIPFSFVVGKDGKIAWAGAPLNLDRILPQVIKGDWDVAKAALKLKENRRLTPIDGNEVVKTLNPYMGNSGRPEAALVRIDSFLRIEPGLKYFPKMGHFTFYALSKTTPKKAVAFAHEWFAANDYPGYSTVTDAVYGKKGLIPELYILAAKSYQAQLEHYPWSMDFAATYKKMAELYLAAGDGQKSKEFLKKAEEAPKK